MMKIMSEYIKFLDFPICLFHHVTVLFVVNFVLHFFSSEFKPKKIKTEDDKKVKKRKPEEVTAIF